MLLGLAAAVWLTALLAEANLMVADALARRDEYRLRSALGARQAQTWSRLFTEATVLAAGAATLAMGIAWALATVAPWLFPMISGATQVEVTIDRGTFTVAALAGAASAVMAALSSVAVALRLARSCNVGRGPGSSRFAAVGLGLQVALASTLVVVSIHEIGCRTGIDAPPGRPGTSTTSIVDVNADRCHYDGPCPARGRDGLCVANAPGAEDPAR